MNRIEKTELLSINQLLIDSENPRFEDKFEDQLKAIQAMISAQGNKIVQLAEDITANGLNPGEPIWVIPHNERFIVVEGNRRICVLKVLGNPDLLDKLTTTIAPNISSRLKELSQDYQKNPVSSIKSIIYPDRTSVDPWIEKRHSGENKGAGLVEWGAQEKARWQAKRKGRKEASLEILDLLEEQGYITPEIRKKVPISTFRRVVETKHIRDNLGIQIKDNVWENREDLSPDSTKLLEFIAKDISFEHKKTKDLYTAEQRKDYFNGDLRSRAQKSSVLAQSRNVPFYQS